MAFKHWLSDVHWGLTDDVKISIFKSQCECHGELGLLFPTAQVLVHSCLSGIKPSYACCSCVTINSDPLRPQKYLSLENKLYGLSTHKNSVYSGISVCIVLKTYELGEDGEFKEMKSLDLFLHEFSIFNNILPAERVLLFTRYPWWLHRATAMWVCCM